MNICILLNQHHDKSRLNLIQVTEITAATSILLNDKIDSKHVIYFDYFSAVLKFPGKNREQAITQTIQLYAERLQHYCLQEPLQWFNFFDFWRVADDG